MTNENVVATTTMVILNQCQNGHRLMVEPILRRIFFRLALILIGQLLGMGLHQRNICLSLAADYKSAFVQMLLKSNYCLDLTFPVRPLKNLYEPGASG